MIAAGSVCISVTPFYDITTRTNGFKKRPVLVLAAADSGDFNVLPISRVTNSRNLDPSYDIQVDPLIYPNLKLTAKSYVRTHKQTVVNKSSLNEISNMKNEYPELYTEILDKLEEYNNNLITNARV
jgi:uncharacterized protein YifN (PemK superfamily)